MAIKCTSNENYMILNMQKNECKNCARTFITPAEISQEEGMICSFCGSSDTGGIVWTTDEILENRDMGCIEFGMNTKAFEHMQQGERYKCKEQICDENICCYYCKKIGCIKTCDIVKTARIMDMAPDDKEMGEDMCENCYIE